MLLRKPLPSIKIKVHDIDYFKNPVVNSYMFKNNHGYEYCIFLNKTLTGRIPGEDINIFEKYGNGLIRYFCSHSLKNTNTFVLFVNENYSNLGYIECDLYHYYKYDNLNYIFLEKVYSFIFKETHKNAIDLINDTEYIRLEGRKPTEKWVKRETYWVIQG